MTVFFDQALQVLNYIASQVSNNYFILLIYVLDITLVAWVIFRFIKVMQGTKIMSLVQGIVLFTLLRYVASFIGLTTVTYIMDQVITYGVIAIVVIFAPEIRNLLERFGKSSSNLFQRSIEGSKEDEMVQAIVKAVNYMSPRRIGALISIEGTQSLEEYIETGIALDAHISSELLINIFIPNTPLHDGAVIVQGDKIAVSCAYLPLSESPYIPKEFGTRHRAAIGLSEVSDAMTVIVSEETGSISIAHKGRFLNNIKANELESILHDHFRKEESKKNNWFKKLIGG